MVGCTDMRRCAAEHTAGRCFDRVSRPKTQVRVALSRTSAHISPPDHGWRSFVQPLFWEPFMGAKFLSEPLGCYVVGLALLLCPTTSVLARSMNNESDNAREIISSVKSGKFESKKHPRLDKKLTQQIINKGRIIFEQTPPEENLNFGYYTTSVWFFEGKYYVIYVGGWADQDIYGVGPIERK